MSARRTALVLSGGGARGAYQAGVLRGLVDLGVIGDDAAITELASYLLFDASFCRRLIELGRADVISREQDVRAFFSDTP